jgi:putative Mg2+ transporter-C (MgtC) family protein
MGTSWITPAGVCRRYGLPTTRCSGHDHSIGRHLGNQSLGHNHAMPTQGELVLRLLLAGALAGLLGVEREMTDQPAGFRTHILVGLGAALFAVISAYGFQDIVAGSNQAANADVTRVASQIVVGIGFLGGGAIIKYGANIRGLTTAANLWITAAIGTAVGIGMLLLGTITTLIALVALAGLRPLRGILRRFVSAKDRLVIDAHRDVDLHAILQRLRDAGCSILEVRVAEDGEEQTIEVTIRPAGRTRPSDLAAEIAQVAEVRNVDWTG